MVKLAHRHPEYHFVVAGMSLLGPKIYNELIPSDSHIDVVYDQTYNLLSTAFAAVVCSGTATLETALFNVPQVVCYRANPISIAIAKTLVGKRIKYISLVNLIADREVVQELLADRFTVDNIRTELRAILPGGSKRAQMLADYQHITDMLGTESAPDNAARLMTEELCKVKI
jgi:lipid-A-disaccharide synthase